MMDYNLYYKSFLLHVAFYQDISSQPLKWKYETTKTRAAVIMLCHWPVGCSPSRTQEVTSLVKPCSLQCMWVGVPTCHSGWEKSGIWARETIKKKKTVSEDSCSISKVSSLEVKLITFVSFDNLGDRTTALLPEAGTNHHHLPQEWLAFPSELRKTITEAWQESGRDKWLRYCVFCIVWCKTSLCRWSWSGYVRKSQVGDGPGQGLSMSMRTTLPPILTKACLRLHVCQCSW